MRVQMNIRVLPETKTALKAAAKREKRSVTNFIESDPRLLVPKYPSTRAEAFDRWEKERKKKEKK